MAHSDGWNRREFVGAAAFVTLAFGVPTAGVMLTDLDSDDPPSDRQMAILNAVSSPGFSYYRHARRG